MDLEATFGTPKPVVGMVHLAPLPGAPGADESLDADVAVFADVDVKHSAPLAEGSVRRELADACERGLADAVIVSGAATGESVDESALAAAVDARESLDFDVPILVGSGVDADSVADQLSMADGVIVGTALKEGGETTAPVSETRVAELVERADEAR